MRRKKGSNAWRKSSTKLIDKYDLNSRWKKIKLRSIDGLVSLSKIPGLHRIGRIARPTISISEKQILARLSQKLPFRKQYLLFFEVLIDNPRLDIHAVDDRFNLGLDIHVYLSDAQARVFHGVLDISMGLNFDAALGTVYLIDPRVAQMRVKGLPDALVRNVAGVVNELLTKYLDRLPVYRLEEDSRSQRALKRVLRAIHLGEGEVILELGING
ncbi:MAG: DUF1439 domain-containing protein [Hahellaceae bacterium]|nr:DUF1439 domain-containing protein [Hahellaceae bacterium]MCP5209921.1 DUF1439 domain-containing protein [Hahellaceae bacterium]